MYPDTWVWIVALAGIVFGTFAMVTITKLIVNYLQGRSGDPTLTTNELAGVIGRAVADAVQPLEDKIDRLEHQQRLLAEKRTEQDAPLRGEATPSDV